jgi:hypothetical protein
MAAQKKVDGDGKFNSQSTQKANPETDPKMGILLIQWGGCCQSQYYGDYSSRNGAFDRRAQIDFKVDGTGV